MCINVHKCAHCTADKVEMVKWSCFVRIILSEPFLCTFRYQVYSRLWIKSHIPTVLAVSKAQLILSRLILEILDIRCPQTIGVCASRNRALLPSFKRSTWYSHYNSSSPCFLFLKFFQLNTKTMFLSTLKKEWHSLSTNYVSTSQKTLTPTEVSPMQIFPTHSRSWCSLRDW